MIFFYTYRTTTNLIFDDINAGISHAPTEIISDEDERDIETNNRENIVPVKRRRSSSCDQMKLYESFAKTLKDNHSQKMNLINQAIESSKPQTELELYFSSICKTVEKLSPIEQAKIKMHVSNIVSQAELAQLQANQQQPIPYQTPYYQNQNGYFQNQNEYNANYQHTGNEQDILVSTLCDMTNLK